MNFFGIKAGSSVHTWYSFGAVKSFAKAGSSKFIVSFIDGDSLDVEVGFGMADETIDLLISGAEDNIKIEAESITPTPNSLPDS